MDNLTVCKTCLQPKPLIDFSAHRGKKSSKTGYRSTCKGCQVAANKEYRARNQAKVNEAKRIYYSNNKDKKAADDKRYREANLERIANNSKLWRKQNKAQIYERVLVYRAANKEKIAATQKAYAQKYPEKVRNIGLRRRAAKALNGIYRVTSKELLAMLAAGCSYCGANAEHIDHIVPISRGGTHSVGNLTGACASCNLSKGAKFITEWKKGKQCH